MTCSINSPIKRPTLGVSSCSISKALILLVFGLGSLLTVVAGRSYGESSSHISKKESAYGLKFKPTGYIYGNIKSIDVIVCDGAPYVYAMSKDEHGYDVAKIYFLGAYSGTQYTYSALLRKTKPYADIGRTPIITRTGECYLSTTYNSLDYKPAKYPSYIPFTPTVTDSYLTELRLSVSFVALISKKSNPKTGEPPEYIIRQFMYADKFLAVVSFNIIAGKESDDVRSCFAWAMENDYYKEARIACFPNADEYNKEEVSMHPLQTIPLLSDPLIDSLELKGADSRTVLIFAQSSSADCPYADSYEEDKEGEPYKEETYKKGSKEEYGKDKATTAEMEDEDEYADEDGPPRRNVLYIWEYKYKKGDKQLFLFKQTITLKGIVSIDTVVTKDNEGFLVVVADSKIGKHYAYDKGEEYSGETETGAPRTAVYIYKYNVVKSKFLPFKKFEIPYVILAAFQKLMPSFEVLLYIAMTGYDEARNVLIYKLTEDKFVLETSLPFEGISHLDFTSFLHKGAWINQIFLTHREGTAIWNIEYGKKKTKGYKLGYSHIAATAVPEAKSAGAYPSSTSTESYAPEVNKKGANYPASIEYSPPEPEAEFEPESETETEAYSKHKAKPKPEHEAYAKSTPKPEHENEHEDYAESTPKSKPEHEHEAYAKSTPKPEHENEHEDYAKSTPKPENENEHEGYAKSTPKPEHENEHEDYAESTPNPKHEHEPKPDPKPEPETEAYSDLKPEPEPASLKPETEPESEAYTKTSDENEPKPKSSSEKY